MSYALKVATEALVHKAIDEYAEALISRSGDTLDQLRFHQGIIFGLRLALDAQKQAHETGA